MFVCIWSCFCFDFLRCEGDSCSSAGPFPVCPTDGDKRPKEGECYIHLYETTSRAYCEGEFPLTFISFGWTCIEAFCAQANSEQSRTGFASKTFFLRTIFLHAFNSHISNGNQLKWQTQAMKLFQMDGRNAPADRPVNKFSFPRNTRNQYQPHFVCACCLA